jgi:hypothetical protein
MTIGNSRTTKRLLMAHLILALVSIHLVGTSTCAQQNEVYTVEVTGEASGGNQSSIEEVERQARKNAVRKAVEQAGVFVSSETTVELGMVARDEVLSWSQGFVKVLEVINSQTDYDPDYKAFRCRIKIRVEVRTGEAKELVTRMQLERTALSDRSSALSFSYDIKVHRKQVDGSWERVDTRKENVVKSGDRLQISIRSSQDCFAYVINRDASGKMYVLFPHQEAIPNDLTADRDYVLPDRAKYYELDETLGEETFYLAVSPAPMTDLQWMLNRVTHGGHPVDLEALEQTLRTRGVRAAARIVSSSAPSDIDTPTQLRGTGPLLQIVTFQHQ